MTSPSASLAFVGPAGENFDSLENLAAFYLQKYWSNSWSKESFMIPPVFTYSTPEVIDEEIQKKCEKEEKDCPASFVTEKKQPSAVITKRQSEQAEKIVYLALQQMIQDHVTGPFIAIHDFDAASKQQILNEILNLSKKDKLREYDFILLGPQMDMIVIEVKKDACLGSSDFKESHEHLPESFDKGLEQVDSMQDFLGILEKHIKHPAPKLKKVMCTPNVQRLRYDQWLDSLSEDAKAAVETKTAGIIQLFQEDLVNSEMDSYKPSLYTAMKKVLVECTGTISEDAYKVYVQLLVGIATMSASEKPSFTLDKNKISDMDAALEQGKNLAEIRRPNVSIRLSTPAQVKIQKGPRRQVIFGAAGTGKTTVLEEQILHLLRPGQVVTVFTRESYAERYKALYPLARKIFASRYEKLKKKGYPEPKLDIKIWSTAWAYDFVSGKSQVAQCTSWMNELAQAFDDDLFKTISWIVWLVVMLHNDDNVQMINGVVGDNLIMKIIWNAVLPKLRNIDIVEIIDCFLEGFIAKRLEKLTNIYDKVLGPGHFLIDDCTEDDYAQYSGPYFFILPVMLFMKLAKRIRPDKYCWVALDPYTKMKKIFGDWMYTQVEQEFMKRLDTGEDLDYSVSSLKEVMRCCTNVYNVAYTDTTSHWHEKAQPICGHCIDGCAYESTKIFTGIETAKSEVWNEVQKVITKVNRAGINLNNMGILVNEHPNPLSLHEFLTRQCQVHGINVISLNSDSMEKNAITIENWDAVSSLEWPIVVVVTCMPNDNAKVNPEMFKYQRYRALSRAMAKVIEIKVTYFEGTDFDLD